MTTNSLKSEDAFLNALCVEAKSQRQAFGELYDRMYPPVFRYCIRRAGDRSIAEDVTSIVFLAVARTISSFQGTTWQELRMWVFRITTNELNATFRKSARHSRLLQEAAAEGRLNNRTEDSPSTTDYRMVKLREVIEQLPDRDQSIISLRFFSEMPYQEISKALNMTPAATRTAAGRAIRRIRDAIGELS